MRTFTLFVLFAFTVSMTPASAQTPMAWGTNTFGQLGVPVPSYTPRQAFMSYVKQISAKGSHTLALKNDGTIWAWGDNIYGQLGDGTTNDRTNPVRVQGLSDVVSISAGGIGNLALKADGTVWAWGDNRAGQCGNDITFPRYTPVQVN